MFWTDTVDLKSCAQWFQVNESLNFLISQDQMMVDVLLKVPPFVCQYVCSQTLSLPVTFDFLCSYMSAYSFGPDPLTWLQRWSPYLPWSWSCDAGWRPREVMFFRKHIHLVMLSQQMIGWLNNWRVLPGRIVATSTQMGLCKVTHAANNILKNDEKSVQQSLYTPDFMLKRNMSALALKSWWKQKFRTASFYYPRQIIFKG